MGTSTLSRSQYAIRKKILGDIYASAKVISTPIQVGISINTKCLESNIQETISLVKSILHDTRWHDYSTLKVIMDQYITQVTTDITSRGNAYASLYANAAIGDESDAMRERLNGLSQIHFLKNLPDTKIVAEKMESIAKRLFDKYTVLVTAEKHIDLEIDAQKRSLNMQVETRSAYPTKAFIPIPFPVNFVAMTIKTGLVQFTDQDHPHVLILSAIIKPLLHAEIREKGGAYGSGASISYHGLFTMSSYRDPHTMNTVNVYLNSVKQVCALENITSVELQEAKLRIFQVNDRPDMPHDRPGTFFYFGIDDVKRQIYRTALLETTLEDIQRVCNKYLLAPGSVAILGSNNNIPSEKEWTIVNDMK
jgi:hypothetical protein